MQLVGEGARDGLLCRHENHSVGVLAQALGIALCKRLCVESAVVDGSHLYMEVATKLHRLRYTVLYLFPIGNAGVLGHDAIEHILPVIGQCTGIHIGLIVHLLESFLYLLACRTRHVGAVVEHSVHRTHRHSRTLGNVFYPYFLCHSCGFAAALCHACLPVINL